jgi:hypothetical protein
MNNNFGLVYKSTNIIGKSYIGQTTRELVDRMYDHVNSSNIPTVFKDAIRKYGVVKINIGEN